MPRHRNRTTPAHAHADPHQQKIGPDAATTEAEKTEVAADPQAAPIASPTMPTAMSKTPTGTLADVIEHIGRAGGATIDDLVAATGWQPHTIRAALSRLRRRGHMLFLSTDTDGRKANRLSRKEG